MGSRKATGKRIFGTGSSGDRKAADVTHIHTYHARCSWHPKKSNTIIDCDNAGQDVNGSVKASHNGELEVE